jgi:ribosome-associated protein
MTEPGRDLTVPMGPGLPAGLVIPAEELVERFSRSSGPGGQGVNTADSRVELLFEPGSSTVLTPDQRDRITERLAGRLVGGRISVVASEHRSQLRNRTSARERLRGILRDALAPPPPPRRATKRTKGSQTRRLEAKKRRSTIKLGRGRQPRD